MENKENLRKAVEANLRSVTQSVKEGVPLERLEYDYRSLVYAPIPYAELGYGSLEQMLRSMPTVVRIVRNYASGGLTVIAVAEEKTAHIASLISKQKSSKTRKPVRSRFRTMGGRGRGGYSRSMYNNFSRNQQPPTHLRSVPQKKIPPRNERSEVSRPPSIPSQKQVPTQKSERPPSGNDSQNYKGETSSHKHSTFEVPPRFMKQQSSGSGRSSKNMVVSFTNDNEERSSFTPEPAASSSRTNSIPGPYLAYNSNNKSKIPSPKPKVKRKVEIIAPPPLPSQLSCREYIEEYARSKNIDYKFLTKEIGQKKKMFISTLKLGSKSFQSFPEERSTPEEAEECAASIAKQKITEEEKNVKLPEAPMNTVEDIQIFQQRVEEILAEKPNCMWSMGIPTEYERRYAQSLPNDWLKILKDNSSNNIDISLPSDRLLFPADAYILKFKNSGSETPTSTSSKTSSHLNEDFNNLNVQSYNNCSELPEENEWDVLVTYTSSTVDIAVRLLESTLQEKFLSMVNNIQEYYKDNYLPLQMPPQVSRLYSAHQVINGDDLFFRVRVNSVDVDAGKVAGYFGDVGVTLNIDFSDLQELDPQFESLSFQAIHLSLEGLEVYEDILDSSHLEEKLLDKPLIAEIRKREDNVISAVLYDTSGETDINLNMVLKEIALEESFVYPNLPEVGTSMCYLTHTTANGEIYLRLNHPSQCLLEIEMEKFLPKFEEAPPVKTLSYDKVYVAQFTDGQYYRTVLTNALEGNENEVEMFYVDYGNCNTVSLNVVKDLFSIHSFLATWPFQAIPCLLTDVPPPNFCWNGTVVEKLYELAPEDKKLIVKVDKPCSEISPPEVTLFIRSDDESIISINQTLLFSHHLFSPDGTNGSIPHKNANKPSSLPLQSISPEVDDIASLPDITSSKANFNNMITSPSELWTPTPDTGIDHVSSLSEDSPPPPQLPEKGSIFDVYITFVASPSNFVVQPLNTSKELDSLLGDMKTFYQAEENQCELHRVLLKLDHFYAALYNNVWYRVKIKGIDDEGDPVMVAVYFIDFGDFAKVSIVNLQPLYQQFRSLPCQAIKAFIHGIKPKYSDWLPEACIETRELLMEKQFVSCVMGYKKIEDDKSPEWTLELNLIDTSLPTQDVYINELLIKNDVATAIS